MARYDSKRKTQRNLALIEYYKKNPNESLREIAGIFGISRQRVWKIVNRKESLNNP